MHWPSTCCAIATKSVRTAFQHHEMLSICSFLIFPCQAYVLYLFLALMLAYLDCDDDEYAVVTYLETGPSLYLPSPFYWCFPAELPRGKGFLRYCKFGTLQVRIQKEKLLLKQAECLPPKCPTNQLLQLISCDCMHFYISVLPGATLHDPRVYCTW